jgi:hypothetical protein
MIGTIRATCFVGGVQMSCVVRWTRGMARVRSPRGTATFSTSICTIAPVALHAEAESTAREWVCTWSTRNHVLHGFSDLVHVYFSNHSYSSLL